MKKLVPITRKTPYAKLVGREVTCEECENVFRIEYKDFTNGNVNPHYWWRCQCGSINGFEEDSQAKETP